MKHEKYVINKNIGGGQPLWIFNGTLTNIEDISDVMREFLTEFPRTGYTLSIFDTNTSRTIEIMCAEGDFIQIAEYIYCTENAAPMAFIGVNDLSESYVIGMSCSRGRIPFGMYRTDNGKLIPLKSPSPNN